MMRKNILNSLVAVFFTIGCATTQPQVTEEPVYVEKAKKVDVNTVISQLSQQISSTMLEQNKRRVAVMNFTLQTGETTELGLYLSDKLTNSLFKYRDKFEVVERTRLESALKEMRLGMTGIIDDKTAQSIGKVLGADALVIGTITDLGSEVDINIRMLGTERANVLAVASSFLEKSDAIVKLMKSIKTTEPGTTTTKPSQPQPKAMPKVVVNDFTFEARECKWYGERVLCNISVMNNLQETRLLKVWLDSTGGRSLLIDNHGNQYGGEELIFGGERGKHLSSQDIPPNLPMNITLIFRGVSPTASTVNTVILCSIDERGWVKSFKAVLRNIPLTR